MSTKKIVNKVKNTKTISWATLKTWEFNDLKDRKRDIKKLKNSIINDGFIAPIFVWADHQYVIDGTGRNLALVELESEGYEFDELPIVEIEATTKQEAKAIVLKISSKYGAISNESWLNFSVDLDVESLLSTINIPDIDIESILNKEKKKTDPDQVPDLPKTPTSKVGDLYQLGEHILICGDSTDGATIELLMAGVKADMVFTDPPYNINYSGNGKNTSNKILNDKMSDDQFAVFLDKVFKQYRKHVKGGGGLYVFHSASTQIEFEQAMEKNGFEIRTQLIWNKPSASIGWGDYRMKHEPFFYASIKGESPQFYGDRTHTSVLDLHKSDEELLKILKSMKEAEAKGKTTIWTMKRDNVHHYIHPTQKPVQLIEYALNNSSKKGDIVMDLFGGSGSTLIACEMTGRYARICELDPKYVDGIIKRWEEFTGEKAIKMN